MWNSHADTNFISWWRIRDIGSKVVVAVPDACKFPNSAAHVSWVGNVGEQVPWSGSLQLLVIATMWQNSPGSHIFKFPETKWNVLLWHLPVFRCVLIGFKSVHCLWLLQCFTTAEVSTCNRDHKAAEPKSVYSLALGGRNLPTPRLKLHSRTSGGGSGPSVDDSLPIPLTILCLLISSLHSVSSSPSMSFT